MQAERIFQLRVPIRGRARRDRETAVQQAIERKPDMPQRLQSRLQSAAVRRFRELLGEGESGSTTRGICRSF